MSLKDVNLFLPPGQIFLNVLYSPTQLSHKLQCEALGGLNILHVKQYLSLTTCPLMTTSFVRGGGLYCPGEPALGTSTKGEKHHISSQMHKNNFENENSHRYENNEPINLPKCSQ